ncbi:MAG: endonuclease/exonuclease/phosphatase family protein [Anaerolineae bacterium]|nr:endonuclease/exonuclease/phosphatase family protein [Anaerolineae bacterium]
MSEKRFKIGTFNLYNMVLPQTLYYGNRMYTAEDYQKKKEWVAGQLREMDADIVGFQEIFHRAALQDVIQYSDIYQNATLIVGDERPDGPVVGLVSRFRVLEYHFVPDFAPAAQLEIDGLQVPISRFARPVLWAKIEIRPDLAVMVFVIHLKSKNPVIAEGRNRHDPLEDAMGKARALIRRAAEATAIRCLLLNKLKDNDNPVLIMGDVNDTDNAVTTEIMAGTPPWRKLDYSVKLRLWDTLLYNVKDVQARQGRRDIFFTHIHNGEYESLDQIMVSQEFVHQNPKRLAEVEYVAVLNDHLIDETLSQDAIPCWQSDHGQVVVTIQLR